jgi:hypothetical protein
MSLICTDVLKFSTVLTFFPITEEKDLKRVKTVTTEKTGK